QRQYVLMLHSILVCCGEVYLGCASGFHHIRRCDAHHYRCSWNHPGLFPGLCVAILGFLPSFERFLFMAVSTAAPKTIDNSIGLQVEMRSTP
ncbi:MAG TPA: hypothetical protein VIR82_18860, partial [Bradyrhizobium sp.]